MTDKNLLLGDTTYPHTPVQASQPVADTDYDFGVMGEDDKDDVVSKFDCCIRLESENEALKERIQSVLLDRSNVVLNLREEVESAYKRASDAEAERDKLQSRIERHEEREQWIHDNAATSGGGNGFAVAFFVPIDHEDIFCGIDAAIKELK